MVYVHKKCRLCSCKKQNIYLTGVLKTGLPEILSPVQHSADNLSKLNLLKALILLV